MAPQAGSLTVVATPIGNLDDLSPRAAQALTAADFWIVEDSRVSGKLQAKLGVKRPMRVLNDHTSPESMERYVVEIESGAGAALLSDAGTPAVSDPGAEIVDACYRRGVAVDVVPGPSAVTAALAISGFYAQRFTFLGYPPRKAGPLRELLGPFADSALTLVVFESPHRIGKLLAACSDALGNRRYAVCRELTKMHQQIWRARLPEVPSEEQLPCKGELTLVIEGRRKEPTEREYN